jgi:hypothetical protein
MNSNQILKEGTKVMWKGCFGMFEAKPVTITHIERSEYKRCKYGKPVDEIPFADREYGIFYLNNEHWCYGEQIVSIVNE